MNSAPQTADDSDWHLLVKYYQKEWEKNPEKALMMLEVGDGDIAIVAYGRMLHIWKEWMDYAAPALDGRTARKCLKSDEGKRMLRDVLMRMHE